MGDAGDDVCEDVEVQAWLEGALQVCVRFLLLFSFLLLAEVERRIGDVCGCVLEDVITSYE